jgi:hypothetical protein
MSGTASGAAPRMDARSIRTPARAIRSKPSAAGEPHARRRRERTGLATAGAGWIDEIIVFDTPLFASRSTLKLGKATLIESEGSIGKTALFQWITAAFTGTMGERWSWCNVHLDLRYMCPKPHRFESTFDKGKRNYIYDNEIIHVEEDKREDDGEEDETPEKDSAPELFLTVTYNGFDQSFRSLSGSENNRVLAEFAAALAREQARRAPTLLLIDGGGWSLGEGSWADLMTFLLTQPFQTILIPSIVTYKDPVWQSVIRSAICSCGLAFSARTAQEAGALTRYSIGPKPIIELPLPLSIIPAGATADRVRNKVE